MLLCLLTYVDFWNTRGISAPIPAMRFRRRFVIRFWRFWQYRQGKVEDLGRASRKRKYLYCYSGSSEGL